MKQMDSCRILTINKPTMSGKIFTRACVEDIIKQSCNVASWYGRLFDPISPPVWTVTIDIADIAHRAVNLRLKGDDLLVDCTILDTPVGEGIQLALAQDPCLGVNFTLSGMGIIDVITGIVKPGYTLHRIDCHLTQLAALVASVDPFQAYDRAMKGL